LLLLPKLADDCCATVTRSQLSCPVSVGMLARRAPLQVARSVLDGREHDGIVADGRQDH
jgi:hypothetical protein